MVVQVSVERPHLFRTGEHAEHAVKAAAGRHCVEVAAKADRQAGVVATGAAEEPLAVRVLLEAPAEREAFGVDRRR